MRPILPATPGAVWSGLDSSWQEAFRQAWEALRTGNIAVGACAATPDGTIVHAARNRIADRHGPAGEVFGSSVAHAEVNVLARLGYGQPKRLVLTTTLEPCLQCSAAIRLAPVAVVRFAGADPVWDGCHDFSPLSPREATKAQPAMAGPRTDEVGRFGTLMSRFGLGLVPSLAEYLRASGESGLLDLTAHLQASGELARLTSLPVQEAFASLWPQLRALREAGGA